MIDLHTKSSSESKKAEEAEGFTCSVRKSGPRQLTSQAFKLHPLKYPKTSIKKPHLLKDGLVAVGLALSLSAGREAAEDLSTEAR